VCIQVSDESLCLVCSDVCHALHQFVFECMRLTSLDEAGAFPTVEVGRQLDIPWDDPYPYYTRMIPSEPPDDDPMRCTTDEDNVSQLSEIKAGKCTSHSAGVLWLHGDVIFTCKLVSVSEIGTLLLVIIYYDVLRFNLYSYTDLRWLVIHQSVIFGTKLQGTLPRRLLCASLQSSGCQHLQSASCHHNVSSASLPRHLWDRCIFCSGTNSRKFTAWSSAWSSCWLQMAYVEREDISVRQTFEVLAR